MSRVNVATNKFLTWTSIPRRTTRRWGYQRRAIATAILGVLCLWTSANADDARGREIFLKTFVWYSPNLLSSVDDAATTLVNLAPLFFTRGGFQIQRIVVDRDGIGIFASTTRTETSSQWIPSYGGSWIGGHYVPYYGGSTVTTETPVTDTVRAWISAKDVSWIVTSDYSYLEPKTPWMVTIYGTKESGDSKYSVQTSDSALARKFADAFATLAAVHGETFLGVRTMVGNNLVWDPTSEFARLKWDRGTGALIGFVFPGSPAAIAGLRKDDIILEVNGKDVINAHGYWAIWEKAVQGKPEVTLPLKVFRGGQEISTQISIRNNLFYREKLISGQKTASGASSPKPFGISVRNLTTEEAQKTGVNEIVGMFIVSVDTNSLAEQMGLKAGDYLLEINGSKIANGNVLRQTLSMGTTTKAKVWREGQTIELNQVSKF